MKKSLLLISVGLFITGVFSCKQDTSYLRLDDLKLGFYKTNIEFIPTKLNEEFSPDSLNYTANVEKSYTASIYITPGIADTTVLLTINGTPAVSGNKFKAELQPGENKFDILLKGKGKAEKTYTLTITQEDLSKVYTSELLAPGVWRIDDFGAALGNENMYLFEGEKKALLFDTGMGKGDLAAYIKTLTSLPVEVAITHGNRDHFMQVDQFKENTVYMSKLDEGRLPRELVTPKFNWVKDGDIIDIGAGRRFEIIEVPGHTMGCLIFLDSANKFAVTGDGIGSGSMVYMFSPLCNSLMGYYNALKHVEEKVKDLDELTLLSGHEYQEKVPLKGTAGKQYITDMRITAEKILSGELVGETAYSIRDTAKVELRQAYYGLGAIWYNPNKLGK